MGNLHLIIAIIALIALLAWATVKIVHRRGQLAVREGETTLNAPEDR
jgi:hypothetical protein